MKSRMILALAVLTFPGCNTRVGVHQSGETAILELAVLGLIVVGVLGMAVALSRPTHGQVIAAMTIIVVAGLLLQVLPHTEGGVQFIPLPPWHYAGWIPRIVSVACWLCFIFAVLCTCSTVDTDWRPAAGATLIALTLNVLLSFAGPPTEQDRPTIVSWREKIERWEAIRNERSEALEKLLADREELVGRIKALGFRTKRELMANGVGHTLATELEQLSRQIAVLQGEKDAIDTALERAKSALRSIERQGLLHGVGSSTEQLCETDRALEADLHRIAGEQTPGHEVQLDRLLGEVLDTKGENIMHESSEPPKSMTQCSGR